MSSIEPTSTEQGQSPLKEYTFTTDCFITVTIDAPDEEAAWQGVQDALSDRNWDDLRMFGSDETEAHWVRECAQVNIGHNPTFELVWCSDDDEPLEGQ